MSTLSKIAAASLTLGLCAAAQAQVANFQYTGTVVAAEGDLAIAGSPQVGQDAAGGFGFDTQGSGSIAGGGDFGLPFNFFAATGVTAGYGDTLFESTGSAGAFVFDNVTINGSVVAVGGAPGPTDAVLFSSAVDAGPGVVASIQVQLEGENTWFSGSQLPDTASLGLENLTSALVKIELRAPSAIDLPDFGPDSPFDGAFDGLDDGQGDLIASVTIEISTLFSNDTVIATIGCSVASLASPVAQFDSADLEAFVESFDRGAPQADFNNDRRVTLADVPAFIDSAVACMQGKPRPAASNDASSNRRPARAATRKSTFFFLRGYAFKSPSADLNGDKAIDSGDLLIFLAKTLTRR